MTKTYNPGRQLPTVPGLIPGVVKFKKRDEHGYDAEFQCVDCHIVEAPQVPVTTTILFHAMEGDGKRRCKPCRIKYRAKYFPHCNCWSCWEDAQ